MGRDANDEDLDPVYSENLPEWIVSGGGNMRGLLYAACMAALFMIIYFAIILIGEGKDGMYGRFRRHGWVRGSSRAFYSPYRRFYPYSGVYNYMYDPALLPVDYAPVYVRQGNRIIEVGGFTNKDAEARLKYRTRR